MHEYTNDRDLIDKYLSNSLTTSEESEFLTMIQKDKNLKDEVLHEKRVITALKARQKADLKAQLKEFSSNIETSPSKKTTENTRHWFVAAAAFLLLASIGYVIYTQNRPVSNYFDAYYEVYPAASIQRGEVYDVEPALRLYSDEKYAQAAAILEKITGDHYPPVHYLYLGNCYLQSNEPDKAIKNFRELTEGAYDNMLQQHAHWYLALTFLKQNEKEKLNTELQLIMGEQGIYSDLATRLYDEVN